MHFDADARLWRWRGVNFAVPFYVMYVTKSPAGRNLSLSAEIEFSFLRVPLYFHKEKIYCQFLKKFNNNIRRNGDWVPIYIRISLFDWNCIFRSRVLQVFHKEKTSLSLSNFSKNLTITFNYSKNTHILILNSMYILHIYIYIYIYIYMYVCICIYISINTHSLVSNKHYFQNHERLHSLY